MLVEWVIVDQVEDGEITMTEDVSDPVTIIINYFMYIFCRMWQWHVVYYLLIIIMYET